MQAEAGTTSVAPRASAQQFPGPGPGSLPTEDNCSFGWGRGLAIHWPCWAPPHQHPLLNEAIVFQGSPNGGPHPHHSCPGFPLCSPALQHLLGAP